MQWMAAQEPPGSRNLFIPSNPSGDETNFNSFGSRAFGVYRVGIDRGVAKTTGFGFPPCLESLFIVWIKGLIRNYGDVL